MYNFVAIKKKKKNIYIYMDIITDLNRVKKTSEKVICSICDGIKQVKFL